MMDYQIEFTQKAAKQFRKLPKQEKKRIQTLINLLAEDQYPRGSKKLLGEDNLYRVRTGNYRIIYTVFEEKVTVLIVKLGHRREVYR